MESLALAQTLASEPLLTKPTEVSKAIAELKVVKTHGPNGVQNWALRTFPRKAVTFLTKIINVVLKWQHYPAVWKHLRVISLFKPGTNPAVPSYYKPISLLD